MIDIQNIQLAQLITPAIIISIAVYLVRFFGKAISDQKPFADDRNWEIELSGTLFLLNYIVFPGIIAFVLAEYWSATILSLANFFIVGIIQFYLLLLSTFLAKKRHKKSLILIDNINRRIHSLKNERFKKIILVIIKFSVNLPLQLTAFIILYILFIEILKSNMIWSVIFIIQSFLSLIMLALCYSLSKYKLLPKINIYFIGEKSPIMGALLLKMNDDNIRIYEPEKRVLIINKSQIDNLEFIESENND